MVEPIIEVYFDPNGSYGGPGTGCYRSRLRDSHGLHDAGKTPTEAVQKLVRNIVCHRDYKEKGKLLHAHLSSDLAEYKVIRLGSNMTPNGIPWDYVNPEQDASQVRDARQVAEIVAHIMTPPFRFGGGYKR